jgi:heptosyltransferase-3
MAVIRRILVLRAGALGDSILTMPALDALFRMYPSAQVEVVGNVAFRELGAVSREALHTVEEPPFDTLFSAGASDALREVDLLILLSTRELEMASQRIAGPKIISASPYPPPGVHAASWLLETVESPETRAATWATARQLPPEWRLRVSESDRASARAHLTALGMPHPVVIHPGAGAVWKRWPAERFAALAEGLDSDGHDILLTAGPADVEPIVQLGSRWAILQEAPLWHLAAILSEASLVIGNDSGVTHLAGAVGTHTLALFGPTDPVAWRPLGPSHILRRCTRRTTRQGEIRVCDDPYCMEALALEEVRTAAREVLGHQ